MSSCYTRKKLKTLCFTCFMTHYLVHIMVLLTLTTLSKIAIGYITCLKNYKVIYLCVYECQQQKQKRGKISYSHPRIPLIYNPMSYISADIKYMPKGIYDYEFLLIAVCEITGFVIAIPIN